jgi:hypothetical protein
MFYGSAIHANKETRIHSASTNLIHISQAALSPSTTGRSSLYIKKNNEKFLVCVLDSEKCPQVCLDLYVLTSENVAMTCDNGEVHLIGYFEPSEKDPELHAQAQKQNLHPVVKPELTPE